MNKPRGATPLWETAVIFGSFILLWLWFIVRQRALSAGATPSFLWQVVLAVSLAALVAVVVRRMRRVLRALRGEDDESSGAMPSRFPSPNGHRKK